MKTISYPQHCQISCWKASALLSQSETRDGINAPMFHKPVLKNILLKKHFQPKLSTKLNNCPDPGKNRPYPHHRKTLFYSSASGRETVRGAGFEPGTAASSVWCRQLAYKIIWREILELSYSLRCIVVYWDIQHEHSNP
jgi:hypothetical protein